MNVDFSIICVNELQPMQINAIDRTILRIIIHAYKSKLVTNRVHPGKPGRQRVVVAEAVGVQAGGVVAQ